MCQLPIATVMPCKNLKNLRALQQTFALLTHGLTSQLKFGIRMQKCFGSVLHALF